MGPSARNTVVSLPRSRLSWCRRPPACPRRPARPHKSALKIGVPLVQVPLGSDDTLQPARLVLEWGKLSVDFLADTELSPTPQSTSAWRHCPDCDFNKQAADAHKPFSFIQGVCCKSHSPSPRWKLRTLDTTLKTLRKAFPSAPAKPLSKTARERILRQGGLRHSLKSVRATLTPTLAPRLVSTLVPAPSGVLPAAP